MQCRVCSGSGARAQTRHLHRARLGAVRRLLPDPRRRLVQPATRGARMGAIGARQAISRSTTRRRARLRPRQPARPTSAVRRSLPTQAAASFTRTTMVSTLMPTRSVPENAARSCCAPERPISLGRRRHYRVLWGTHGGTHRLPWGTHGILLGPHGIHMGVHTYRASHEYPASGLKVALDAAPWLGTQGLSASARQLL